MEVKKGGSRKATYDVAKHEKEAMTFPRVQGIEHRAVGAIMGSCERVGGCILRPDV